MIHRDESTARISGRDRDLRRQLQALQRRKRVMDTLFVCLVVVAAGVGILIWVRAAGMQW